MTTMVTKSKIADENCEEKKTKLRAEVPPAPNQALIRLKYPPWALIKKGALPIGEVLLTRN